jgi:hypothetical protein
MMRESEFRDLVSSLKTGRLVSRLRDLTVTADTVIQADAGGYAELRLERTEVTVASLLDMWKSGEITAVSVEIDTPRGVRRGCVFRCDDGAVQHDTCSETDDDMLHCVEALRGRCSS